MNAPTCQPEDDINFLIASPRVVSGTEAARVQPDREDPPAHDAFTRLPHRLEPDSDTRWAEAAPQVRRDGGILVLDDSCAGRLLHPRLDPGTLASRVLENHAGQSKWPAQLAEKAVR
jgi:hypothetical protein